MKRFIGIALAGAAILLAPVASADNEGSNTTLNNLCSNIAYAHHHHALCANAHSPTSYND